MGHQYLPTERLVYLRVKICSLADEARRIRKEEKRAKDQGRTALIWSLSRHRKIDVRREARAALLAYGYLRGVPYRDMEKSCREEPDWGKVWRNVRRFSDRTDKGKFKEWRETEAEEEEEVDAISVAERDIPAYVPTFLRHSTGSNMP